MKRFLHFFTTVLSVSLITLSSISTQAAGVALGATRVIYPEDAREVSLQITNNHDRNQFLVQTWVDDISEKKTADLIVTPPLYVSKPKTENTLRIMYVGDPPPRDREVLYWLNSKSIPSIDTDAVKGINVLQIAVLSRIKLFIRPKNLPISPSEALQKLVFTKQGSKLLIQNPSPYFITLVNMKLGDKPLPATMVAPKDSAAISLPQTATDNHSLSYQTINDYGAQTPRTSVVLQ